MRTSIWSFGLLGLLGLAGPAAAQTSPSTILGGVAPANLVSKPIDTSRLRTILQNATALLGARVELEATRRKLRDAGLGHFPGNLPTHQTEWIYLFRLDSPADALITCVFSATEGGRTYLSTSLRAMNAPDKSARLKGLLKGSAEGLLREVQRIS